MNRIGGVWTTIGWQHVYLEVPEEWSIGAVSGDYTTGYLRLDDSEMPRVEIRWEPSKGNETVDQVVERFLDTLLKKSRKKSPPIKIRRNLTLVKDSKQLEDRSVESFHWKTEGDDPIQAYGLLWRCEICGRTLFVQILGRLGETVQPLATRILSTLRDHPEDETAIWSVYGMRFKLSAQDTLKSHKFLTGRLTICFTGDDDQIEIDRYSLAETQLDGASFDEWYEERGIGTVEESDELRDDSFRHPGVLTEGTVVDPASASQRMAWLPWRRPKRIRFERCGWYCVDGNKLYLVRRIGTEANRERLLQVAQTVTCH
ncbi:MAG: hypothetical protein HOH43_09830 [Candidatus Latescibacteria bacterium]|nr:hypothetical protein [Candidatus Latescibacterota bacterium]